MQISKILNKKMLGIAAGLACAVTLGFTTPAQAHYGYSGCPSCKVKVVKYRHYRSCCPTYNTCSTCTYRCYSCNPCYSCVNRCYGCRSGYYYGGYYY